MDVLTAAASCNAGVDVVIRHVYVVDDGDVPTVVGYFLPVDDDGVEAAVPAAVAEGLLVFTTGGRGVCL
jgi:hypothetical protein